MTEFDIFSSEEDEFIKEAVIATYYYSSLTSDVMNVAKMIASEQTTGTWVRAPSESEEILIKHHGRIINIWEIPIISRN